MFCANDALLFTLLRDQAVRLEAQPPHGAALNLTLRPEGPEQLDLWHTFTDEVEKLPKVEGMPSSRCPYLHLFEHKEDAEHWLQGLPAAFQTIIRIQPLGDVWLGAQRRIEALASCQG